MKTCSKCGKLDELTRGGYCNTCHALWSRKAYWKVTARHAGVTWEEYEAAFQRRKQLATTSKSY